MERRDFLKTVGLGMGVAMLEDSRLAATGKRPNLLYVFPDQFRREAMGFWRQKEFAQI